MRKPVFDPELNELKRLSEKSGGWIRWDDDADQYGEVVFVPMDEWIVHLLSV